MSETSERSEFLVISRGQWDPALSRDEIQGAIDRFYVWIEQLVADGRMKRGQRLGDGGRTVARNLVTDGPFGESKEVIGGYWFISARDLREAAELAAQNPCAQYGLTFEIRPLEAERASVYRPANETPTAR